MLYASSLPCAYTRVVLYASSLPCTYTFVVRVIFSVTLMLVEGGVRVCGDAVLRYFWCGSAVIFILTRGIAVSKH